MEQAVRRMEGRQQGDEERLMIPLMRNDPGLATIDRRLDDTNMVYDHQHYIEFILFQAGTTYVPPSGTNGSS